MIALLIFCCFTDKMCVISFFLDGHEGKRRNPRNVIRPDPRGVVGGGETLIGRLRNWTTYTELLVDEVDFRTWQ